MEYGPISFPFFPIHCVPEFDQNRNEFSEKQKTKNAGETPTLLQNRTHSVWFLILNVSPQ